jgi:hypothetical protein
VHRNIKPRGIQDNLPLVLDPNPIRPHTRKDHIELDLRTVLRREQMRVDKVDQGGLGNQLRRVRISSGNHDA